MEKKMMLGVERRKKNKPIKRKKKTLLKKVVDYLKSDSYLFSPLISETDMLASKIVSSSSITTTTTTTTTEESMKENMKGKNKRLVEKVWDYLKSDSYLYASLFASQQVIFPKVAGKYTRRVTDEVSTRESIRKKNKSTVETSNVTVEDQFTESDLSERSVSGQQKLLHQETVKHMVYQSCRSSSASEKGGLNSQPRKVLID